MAVRWLCAGVLLSGCLWRTPVPMTRIEYAVNPPARCLVVLMPGAGSSAGDFEKEGFVQKLQNSGLSIDVVAANATIGYYMKELMLTRVHEDVFTPLLASKQYEKRWIMGMSMGGFGSLFYAMHYPKDVDGVFAMAPWLGDEKLVREIIEAGGLEKWQAPAAEPVNGDNYQRQFWRWLQDVTNEPSKGPDLWLGWGTDDSLGRADQVLADRLPKEKVLLTGGGHDWPPWNELVERFAKEGPLAKDCAKQ
jgi:pimeloyl-ACP methyl ester carboxylesterase